MITDNGVFCLKCGCPMVAKEGGKFICYNKECDYVFNYSAESDGKTLNIRMASTFTFPVLLPPLDDGEKSTGVLRY